MRFFKERASEIMYQIRRKTRLTVLLLTALVLHFTVEGLLHLVMGIVVRFFSFFFFFFWRFFFFFRKSVTERYRKRASVYMLKRNKNVVTEPFFIVSVPKGVISRLGTFLGTERIKLERVKGCLHVKFCRSRSSFYPSRSNFFGRVNGP